MHTPRNAVMVEAWLNVMGTQRGRVYQSHCGCWTIRDDFLEEVKITFPFWLFIKSNTSNEQTLF